MKDTNTLLERIDALLESKPPARSKIQSHEHIAQEYKNHASQFPAGSKRHHEHLAMHHQNMAMHHETQGNHKESDHHNAEAHKHLSAARKF